MLNGRRRNLAFIVLAFVVATIITVFFVVQFPSVKAVSGNIYGIVYNDLNANDIQDVGENGISGITLTLYSYSQGKTMGTTITDDTGHYTFGSVASGGIAVLMTIPIGNIATQPTKLGAYYSSIADGQSSIYNFGINNRTAIGI